jgi:hypothetical protein
MARFVVTLSEEQRALLEAQRVKFGHRSLADALRGLIDSTAPTPEAEREHYVKEAVREALSKTYMGSRLKGEWKAP